MIAVAITMLASVLPSAATMPIASTNSGKAMIVSATRETIRSGQPPKKPAAAPSVAPIANDSATAATASPRSSRAATTQRDRMSRPSASVPNQCAADGGCNALEAFVASGSYGTSSGPKRASSTSPRNSVAATSVTGFSVSTWRR